MTDVTLTDLTAEHTPPKIEFPCKNYRISVMGTPHDNFHQFVLETVAEHAPDHDGTYTIRESNKGNFIAVVVHITATGEEQLKALHSDLRKDNRVRMVL